MKYFKNTDLAKLYHVSEKSVRNWIESAESGKLQLALHKENSRSFIANTASNVHQVERIVQKGRKFRNTRGTKTITPTEKFYKYLSTEQIFDIISGIDIHREIDQKYSYFAEGAEAWNKYVKHMADEEYPNLLSDTIDLLELSQDYLDTFLAGCSGVNVIDIGVGNGMPVKPLLQHLLGKKVLNRYLALDTSSDMIDIAQKNIESWFAGQVPFERYVKDVNYDRFDELLVADSFSKGEEKVINLVLYLGSGIANMRNPDFPLRTISASMGKDDIFVLSRRLDTPEIRRLFDIGATAKESKLKDRQKAIVEMLGIEESFYHVEQFFDTERMRRVIQIRLNVDLSINFKLGDKKRIIYIHKGEPIILWHANHAGMIEVAHQFDKNGFDIQQLTKSKDQQHLQIISKIRIDQ
ncbi:MAG: L-histidine N(alpha)-methyltransferase [Candidatus Saccharimonadales bacterium]